MFETQSAWLQAEAVKLYRVLATKEGCNIKNWRRLLEVSNRYEQVKRERNRRGTEAQRP